MTDRLYLLKINKLRTAYEIIAGGWTYNGRMNL